MTPLLFIIIVATVLGLLLYWVLSTIKTSEDLHTKIPRFNYEVAPELATYGESELYVPQNSIKFFGYEAKSMFAYWNLDQEQFAKLARENNATPDPERIVLRLYEVSEWLRYYDIKVKSISGRCRFELQPQISYYVVLGLNQKNKFIPLLTSNTIKKNQLTPSL